jgi:hypothetical protein
VYRESPPRRVPVARVSGFALPGNHRSHFISHRRGHGQASRRPESTGISRDYDWPCLFPQHGPGEKHLRTIRLEHWQWWLVERHPAEFIAGLIHSDGCRAINRVTVRGKQYEYPRYFFSNHSEGILELFTRACGLLGVECRPNRRNSISVAKRSSVEILDDFIGPKR